MYRNTILFFFFASQLIVVNICAQTYKISLQRKSLLTNIDNLPDVCLDTFTVEIGKNGRFKTIKLIDSQPIKLNRKWLFFSYKNMPVFESRDTNLIPHEISFIACKEKDFFNIKRNYLSVELYYLVKHVNQTDSIYKVGMRFSCTLQNNELVSSVQFVELRKKGIMIINGDHAVRICKRRIIF